MFRHCLKNSSKKGLEIMFFGSASSTNATVKRGIYGVLTDSDMGYFERVLGSSNVLRNEQELDVYNTDWMRWYKGRSECALLPESSDQVSAVVRHCFERNLALVPQSGNTGLVGASVPVSDEIVLSLKKLNKRFEFNSLTGILCCDSGWILQTLDERLEQYGHMMPLDLGSKGSCLIGGNVATAAGGMRLIRYGSLHAHVLALQVVLADKTGTVLERGVALRKDNTAFHDHHVFIGSEGQLGVITALAMNVVVRPNAVNSFMIGCASFDACCQVLQLARRYLGEILSSFEFMDSETIRCLRENQNRQSVLDAEIPFQLLIETSGSSDEHDKAKIESFLSLCLEKELAVDGVQATSGSQAKQFWDLRENATLALMDDGYVYKHDISLPLQDYYKLSEAVRQRAEGLFKRVITYGHLADGNTHLNVTSNQFSQQLHDCLYPFVYEWTSEHGGSISAEHGIGRLKKSYISLGKSPQKLQHLRKLKRFYDERLILNPHKMIDP